MTIAEFGATIWGRDWVRLAEPIQVSRPNPRLPKARSLVRNDRVEIGRLSAGTVQCTVISGSANETVSISIPLYLPDEIRAVHDAASANECDRSTRRRLTRRAGRSAGRTRTRPDPGQHRRPLHVPESNAAVCSQARYRPRSEPAARRKAFPCSRAEGHRSKPTIVDDRTAPGTLDFVGDDRHDPLFLDLDQAVIDAATKLRDRVEMQLPAGTEYRFVKSQ